MRIGISPFGSTREGAIEVARDAIAGGIDALWVGDGLLRSHDFPRWAGAMEAFAETAWLAGRFPAVRVGIAAAVLPLRDVDWLAKQAMTLDHLTAGNFVLAVAPGFWETDFAHRSVDFGRRGSIFEARLETLLVALAGDTALAPGPGDGVPVWLAGGRATMFRALARGLPYLASRARPDDLAPLASEWRQRGGRLLAHRIRAEVDESGGRGTDVEWRATTGSPAHLVDALGRFRELGVDDLSIIPGQDDATARRTVEALVTHVLPQLSS